MMKLNTLHAALRTLTDDFIECPSCYDTLATTDLLKNRCFKAGTTRSLTKLMPMIKSTECTAQDGYIPFIMSTISSDVTRVVDGSLPFDNGDMYDVDSENEAAVLDMALGESKSIECAVTDVAEVERVHNELLRVYACQAKAKTLHTDRKTVSAGAKGGMGSLRSTGQLWDPCGK